MNDPRGPDDGLLPCDSLIVAEPEPAQPKIAGRKRYRAETQSPLAELPDEIVAVSTDSRTLARQEILDDECEPVRGGDGLTSLPGA